MNLASFVTDNIGELLTKVLEFTQSRQRLLTQNINNMHHSGYVPKDLAVDEFSALINLAISEHCSSKRLLLCDSTNIKFGPGGTFEARAVVDEKADILLRESRDEYLEYQINKLLENSLNQKVAAELLKQKEGLVSIFD